MIIHILGQDIQLTPNQLKALKNDRSVVFNVSNKGNIPDIFKIEIEPNGNFGISSLWSGEEEIHYSSELARRLINTIAKS